LWREKRGAIVIGGKKRTQMGESKYGVGKHGRGTRYSDAVEFTALWAVGGVRNGARPLSEEKVKDTNKQERLFDAD